MAKKYKVEFEKPQCIGAFACVAVFPEYWEVGQDGKAIFKGSKQLDGEKFVLEIDEKDLEKMKQSAESCPVNVIHIYDDQGNKII